MQNNKKNKINSRGLYGFFFKIAIEEKHLQNALSIFRLLWNTNIQDLTAKV